MVTWSPRDVLAACQHAHSPHGSSPTFGTVNQNVEPSPSVDVTPGYWAMYENNDPSRRMIALANHNNDIAEYWEWSAECLYNPDPTSNAYRLGVNYFIDAVTH